VLHLVVISPIRKEKKRKRNIDNDLAILYIEPPYFGEKGSENFYLKTPPFFF